MCRYGARVVQREVLEKISSPSLAAYLVWLPVQPNDNHHHAIGARRLALDSRAQHFWSAEQRLGQDLARALPLDENCQLAWDVYLVYSPRALWPSPQPPTPNFWMHQLSCMSSQELRLHGETLRAAVRKELEQNENENADF